MDCSLPLVLSVLRMEIVRRCGNGKDVGGRGALGTEDGGRSRIS